MSSSEPEFFDCCETEQATFATTADKKSPKTCPLEQQQQQQQQHKTIKLPPPLPDRTTFITKADDSENKGNIVITIDKTADSDSDCDSETSTMTSMATSTNQQYSIGSSSFGSIRTSSKAKGAFAVGANGGSGRKVRVRSFKKEKMEFSSLHLIQELKTTSTVDAGSDSDLTDFEVDIDEDGEDGVFSGSEKGFSGSIGSTIPPPPPPSQPSQPIQPIQTQRPLNTSPAEEIKKGPSLFVAKFSNDGTFLAVAGESGSIWVWKLAVAAEDDDDFKSKASSSSLSLRKDSTIFSPVPYQVFEGHEGDVVDVSWSKNDFLLSSSIDQTVRLWHHSRKDCLGIFTHPDIVTSISFHPRDDRLFMSGCMDCRVRLWSITDRAVKHWNELPSSNFITAVSFSHSGKWALAGTSTGVCLMFDGNNFLYQTQIHVQSNRGKNRFGHKICGIEPMPGKLGDELILISTNDSRIRLYTLRDKSIICKFYGHINQSSQIKASFSDDGEYCISGGEDGKICIWSVENRFGKRGFWRRIGDRFSGANGGSSGKVGSNDSINSNTNSSYQTSTSSSFFNTGAKLRAIINRKFKGEYVKGVEYWNTHSRPVMSVVFAPSCVKMKLQAFGLRPILGSRADLYSEGHIIVAVDLKGRIRVYENNSLLYDWMRG